MRGTGYLHTLSTRPLRPSFLPKSQHVSRHYIASSKLHKQKPNRKPWCLNPLQDRLDRQLDLDWKRRAQEQGSHNIPRCEPITVRVINSVMKSCSVRHEFAGTCCTASGHNLFLPHQSSNACGGIETSGNRVFRVCCKGCVLGSLCCSVVFPPAVAVEVTYTDEGVDRCLREELHGELVRHLCDSVVRVRLQIPVTTVLCWKPNNLVVCVDHRFGAMPALCVHKNVYGTVLLCRPDDYEGVLCLDNLL